MATCSIGVEECKMDIHLYVPACKRNQSKLKPSASCGVCCESGSKKLKGLHLKTKESALEAQRSWR